MTDAKDQTEFTWLATESAPHHFPMQIINGSFGYHGSGNDGLYVPSGGVLYRGWGSAISSHVVGSDVKPLPDRLNITFYSYMEDTFYKGNFNLPYEKILALFREGVQENKDDPTYRYVMVGVAPGGSVAVWVKGKQSTVEVFFSKATKVELDLAQEFGVPVKDRAIYVNDIVVDSVKPEILDEIRKNGIPFDRWEKYRTQYQWMPTFVGADQPDFVNVIYFNGESNKRFSINDKNLINEARPIPQYLGFSSLIKGETAKDVFLVHLDEAEMFDAFAKLGSNNEQLYMEFSPTLPKTAMKIRLFNGKESIVLNKWTVEEW